MSNDNIPVTLYKKNQQYVQAIGVTDASGNPVNDATISATLTDAEGEKVEEIDELQLDYVAGSDGNYEGLVEGSFDPAPGLGYTLTLVIDRGGGETAEIEHAVMVAVRHD